MPVASFTVHRPDPSLALPLVIHVPHAAGAIPPWCRGDFAVDDAALDAAIGHLVDHDTDRLALGAVALGAHVFVDEVCRVVVDPERYADDADEPAAAHGLGAVYTHLPDGRRLRRADWSAADRAVRLAAFYHPHHRAMGDLVAELHGRFGGPVHLLDLHSFPAAPLPFEVGAGPRPLYCLGYEPGRAPAAWLAWWDHHTRGAPAPPGRVTLAHNRPYAGAFTPADLPPAVEGDVRAMMLEVERSLLPPWPERPALPAAHARAALAVEFLRFACDDLRRHRGAHPEGSRS